jgi:hypothetical protein
MSAAAPEIKGALDNLWLKAGCLERDEPRGHFKDGCVRENTFLEFLEFLV